VIIVVVVEGTVVVVEGTVVVVEGTVVVVEGTVVVVGSLKQNSPFSKLTFSKGGPGVHPPLPLSRQDGINNPSKLRS
jgi:hypothetical protein